MQEHALELAIKLASNENPYDPLPSVLAELAVAAGAINRYPDHRAAVVREALAERLGLTSAHVAIGCGSVGLLQQLLLAFADPGDEVLYAWRSFEAYPIYTAIVGATEVTTPLRFHGLDMAALAKAVTDRTRCRARHLAQQPDGHRHPPRRAGDRARSGTADDPRGARRGLLRVRHRPPRSARHGAAPALPEPGRPADVLQGLWPGRACGSAM